MNISPGWNPGTRREETARTSQEKHGRLRFRVILECQRALIPAFLHSSWPWKRDATVSEDYALMMMMMMIMMIMMMCVSPNWRQTIETGQRTTRVNSSATRLSLQHSETSQDILERRCSSTSSLCRNAGLSTTCVPASRDSNVALNSDAISW